MERKDHMDAFGAVSLIGFALFLAFNQVVIKVTNGGLQPVFFAGLRSLGAILCIYAWMRFRGIRLNFGAWGPGLLVGTIFAAEFVCLFLALDLTSVSRSSVIFYSMPVWMAIGAHFLLGERITRIKAVGLSLAFTGVAVAIFARPDEGDGSLIGDLCALGAALGWAASALGVRATRLKEDSPEMQLFWQVLVSAPLLLIAAPFFGPLIRELASNHLWGLGFQIIFVVSGGFIFWLWLLSLYPASSVASFSFLSPVFGVLLGWLLLGEEVGPLVLTALVLVAAGLILINRRPRQVPQNV
ncbi:DMT family transporter [Cognatishimia sp. MH4019]|uniref:DMT family transporter n=1 Tax=Cognatishimia sp. MH4019 TaxID=2854030 RepID=UPI001CD5BA39|nr:DMT family transporter [Cognatishimia sp. MH4019]